jgi:hypothetical protein
MITTCNWNTTKMPVVNFDIPIEVYTPNDEDEFVVEGVYSIRVLRDTNGRKVVELSRILPWESSDDVMAIRFTVFKRQVYQAEIVRYRVTQNLQAEAVKDEICKFSPTDVWNDFMELTVNEKLLHIPKHFIPVDTEFPCDGELLEEGYTPVPFVGGKGPRSRIRRSGDDDYYNNYNNDDISDKEQQPWHWGGWHWVDCLACILLIVFIVMVLWDVRLLRRQKRLAKLKRTS